MDQDLRIAVIGGGRMGQVRARAAVQKGARVVAVWDREEGAAQALATEMDAVAVPSLEQLPWDELDALFVCTPPSSREAATLRAIAAGVPFFVEKPVGVEASGCASVVRALAERPVVAVVGYHNRLRPSVVAAREQLDNATILGAACHWVGKPYRVPWWAVEEQSGGPINEQGTHLVDLARHLGGEIVEVQAQGSTASAAAVLHYDHGAKCTLLYDCHATKKAIAFHVFTPAETVALAGWELRPAHEPPAAVVDKTTIFVEETASFLRSVRAGEVAAPSCSFHDALATQRVMDALRRALKSGTVERVS